MAGIIYAPFVDIVTYSLGCTQFQGADRKDTRTCAAIQHATLPTSAAGYKSYVWFRGYRYQLPAWHRFRSVPYYPPRADGDRRESPVGRQSRWAQNPPVPIAHSSRDPYSRTLYIIEVPSKGKSSIHSRSASSSKSDCCT